MRTYTGIGSRETPKDTLNLMMRIGFVLAKDDWTLRSGRAPGADQAFEQGALLGGGSMEIYLPWAGFEKAPAREPYIVPADQLGNWAEALDVAKMFHPAWSRCSQGARKLHARNVYQIAGRDLLSRTEFVVCWTPGGGRGGGTGEALRMAQAIDVPIFDLFMVDAEKQLLEFLEQGVIP